MHKTKSSVLLGAAVMIGMALSTILSHTASPNGGQAMATPNDGRGGGGGKGGGQIPVFCWTCSDTADGAKSCTSTNRGKSDCISGETCGKDGCEAACFESSGDCTTSGFMSGGMVYIP